MAFYRQWLWIFCVLVLGGGQVMAASREERAFAAAAAALQDGLWNRAETEFIQFTNRFSKSVRMPEAVLALAQAQCQQGKFTAAIALLSATRDKSGRLADRYAYWLGQAQFGRGDFEHAAATFSALPKDFPESPLCLTAVVEAAIAYERQGDWPQLRRLLSETNGVFVVKTAQDSGNELVSRGRLLLAQAQLAQEDYPGALATLKLLPSQLLAPDLDWQRANLLCRVQSSAGDLVAALATSSNLLQLARSQKDASKLADSVAWRGTVLERLGRWSEAGVAWSENLTNTAPVEWQREAILRMAGAAAVQKDFATAATVLETFLAQFTNSPAAELALLTLGELQLKDFIANPAATNQLALAQASFNRLLDVSTNGSLAGKAFLDRGWCFWVAGNVAESLVDFRAAAAQLPVSEDLAVAKFKAGDALFVLKDYAGACDYYQSMLNQFGQVPSVVQSLGASALYQILRANIELTNATGAQSAMNRLLEQFPASPLRDKGQLLLAEGYSDWSSTTNAFIAFQDFIRLFPDSPLLPQVALAEAKMIERDHNWSAAITHYEDWRQRFPTHELLPQVDYALAWAYFQAGRETNALELFTALVTRFPTNELAPLAQWWVADYYYRQGGTNFLEAEKNYELVFQTPAWRHSTLFYPAQLMAGRTAVARQGFPDAANYLTELVSYTNCPEPLKTQALFAYGSVLMRMDSPDTNRPFLNFETATNVFTLLYQANATNELGALAVSELGDCNLQLGALDAATNAYAQVMNSPYAGAGLRSRAQVGLGLVLEKKAALATGDDKKTLLQLAMNNYLDVFDAKNLRDDETADSFWLKKAGLQALPLRISAGETDETGLNNFFKRLEEKLPQLTEMLERKKAALSAGKE